MVVKQLPALAGLGVILAGCVAPEQPAPPRVSRPAVAPAPEPPAAQLEDAPVPNRKMGAPADTVIRVQK